MRAAKKPNAFPPQRVVAATRQTEGGGGRPGPGEARDWTDSERAPAQMEAAAAYSPSAAVRALQSPLAGRAPAAAARASLQVGGFAGRRGPGGAGKAGAAGPRAPRGGGELSVSLDEVTLAGVRVGLAPAESSGVVQVEPAAGPSLRYVQLDFPEPADVASIAFQNDYTYSVKVKARRPGTPGWETCLEEFRLMGSPHHEDDAQKCHVLTAGTHGFSLEGVTALRFYLCQPSPTWAHRTPGLAKLSCYLTSDSLAILQFLGRFGDLREVQQKMIRKNIKATGGGPVPAAAAGEEFGGPEEVAEPCAPATPPRNPNSEKIAGHAVHLLDALRSFSAAASSSAGGRQRSPRALAEDEIVEVVSDDIK